ncbi:MAG: pyruvate ferredoxin oxidoreductase [Ruminococcus sp.]
MKNKNSKRMMLDGNAAAAEAIKAVNVPVIVMYPITPQTPLVERLSVMVDEKEIDGVCVCVESEHSAMSYVIGSQLTGVRSVTATASVGLALMHEVLGVAAGCRLPIVMPVINRALVAPWSLWCDHQDAMAERDTGWMQLYAENAQEVYDYMIMGYRIAEHKDVLLPLMVCMDGFYVSHAMQTVIVEERSQVEKFVGEYTPCNLVLNPEKPMFVNNLTSPAEFTEMRYQQEVAFENALDVMESVFAKFKQTFGRTYQLIEAVACEDAEVVMIGIGSMCGTIKQVVKEMRKEGKKVGMVKITAFRPFPFTHLKNSIGHVKKIVVLDRSAGLGAAKAPLALEVTSALDGLNCHVTSYVAGLGGRDITEALIEKIFEDNMQEKFSDRKQWVDKKENAMKIRKNLNIDTETEHMETV